MFAFGEKLERIHTDVATERARIKKGKVLGRRQSVSGLAPSETLTLPNITTTQLTQNSLETAACRSCKEGIEGMPNGIERKPLNQIAKQGRLRDSTFMLEDNGKSGVDQLEGLFISKLNFNREGTEESAENILSSSDKTKPRKQQHSRLSKSDSGFCELDSGDDLVPAVGLSGSTASQPHLQDSDKASNISSNNSVTAPEKRRKITLDFKDILNQDKAVIRNTEKLNFRPINMCLQSHQSLHADLVAFKSLSTHHKEAISNCSLQTNEHCIKLREVVLKTKTNIYDDAVKQSDTSLAVLKTRRRLLSKRNSSCPPFPFVNRRNKERSMDLGRATYNSKHRLNFSDARERSNSYRQCVSCPVELRSSQTIELCQSRGELELTADTSPAAEMSCSVSTSGLTEKALLDASRSQETANVNAKCQEWLNRLIGCNGIPKQGTI